VCDRRQKRVVELLYVDCPEHQPRVAELALARGHGEVKGAIDNVCTTEPGIAVTVTHAQNRHHRQMSAGRLAADSQDIAAKLLFAVLYEPGGSGLAIIRSGRIRMFGRQSIFGGNDGLTRVVGDPFKHRVLHVGAAEYPTAAVEM